MAVVVSAQYTGNGTSQTITVPGSPGTPVFVWIKRANATTGDPVMWTTTMGANSKRVSGALALVADGVTGAGANTFNVGSSARVNTSGVVYYYVVVCDNGVGDIATGSYVGTGASKVVATGIPVDLFLTIAAGAFNPGWKVSDQSGDTWYYSFSQASGATAGISFNALNGEVTVTTSDGNNRSGETYHWIAISKSDVFDCGTFVGDGTSSHDVTPFPVLTCESVWSKGSAGASAAAIRFQDNAGDSSSLMGANSFGTDRIQAIITQGIQVGGSDGCNTNLETYNVVGFKEGVGTGPRNPLVTGGGRQRTMVGVGT